VSHTLDARLTIAETFERCKVRFRDPAGVTRRSSDRVIVVARVTHDSALARSAWFVRRPFSRLRDPGLMARWGAPPRVRHRFLVHATVMLLGAHVLVAGPNRVFVEPLGTKSGAVQLRNELVRLLEKEHRVTLVSDVSAADFVVSGEGETYIKGYVGTNPRVRYLNGEAKPVYGGFLSVEVKNRERDTIWSYLVTPRRLGSEDINRNLTGQLIRKLVGAIEEQQGSPK
jgi:hypothetical protein